MRSRGLGLAAFGAGLALSAPAQALDSVHLGVMAHNVCIQNCDSAGREDGPNIELQASWDSPEFLGFLFSPRPYALASVNVAGDTSFFGGGLEWRWAFADGWSLDPGLGYVVHDGATELPYPAGTPEAAAFTEENVLLGSEDLWRLSIGVTRDLPGPWEAQFMVLHVSHGQILGSGRNQGLDQVGVRLGYKFGE